MWEVIQTKLQVGFFYRKMFRDGWENKHASLYAPVDFPISVLERNGIIVLEQALYPICPDVTGDLWYG